LESKAKQTYRLLKNIKDPKFSIDRLDYYSLSLHLGPRDFQMLITDTELNRCLLLEDYILEMGEADGQQHLGVVKKLFDEHHLLRAGFWKNVTFSWKNRKFVLVPNALYSSTSGVHHLTANATVYPDHDLIFTRHHDGGDFVNVFAGDKGIFDFLQSTYINTSVHYVHQSSVLIDRAIAKSRLDSKETLLLYIDRFSLHIAVAQGGSLRFYNQFPIKKFEEYIRFVHMVTNELGLRHKEARMLLYGYLGKNTPHYEELKKAMGQLQLGTRPEGLTFGYVFDEVSDHQYFDLYGIYLTQHTA
jgi:hypothetical protein